MWGGGVRAFTAQLSLLLVPCRSPLPSFRIASLFWELYQSEDMVGLGAWWDPNLEDLGSQTVSEKFGNKLT